MTPLHRRIFTLVIALAAALPARSQAFADPLDLLDEHLTINAFDGFVRARLSGLVDLEGYAFDQPPPGLIDTEKDTLFNTRVTLNLDVQIGPKIYLFAQGRIDRGFDPSDYPVQARFDQYAVRVTPWDDGRFNLQIGKFATVVGNWTSRHDSWDNPLITAPLPYENLTPIWDTAGADSAETLVEWADTSKILRNPVIWGPSYTSGMAVSGRIGKFDYAAEVKNAPLSSRPYAWDVYHVGFNHPTFSGRIGWRPNEAWNLGVSSSVGDYLLPEAYTNAGSGIGDYRQITLAQDVSFAWHHWQIWAEFFENRFAVPSVGNADTFSYYIEAKYKFTPQLFGAVRWNQQLYGSIPDGYGGRTPWGPNISRIDVAVTYRFTPHIQTKLQYSYQNQWALYAEAGHLLAAQFTVRF